MVISGLAWLLNRRSAATCFFWAFASGYERWFVFIWASDFRVCIVGISTIG